MTQTIFSMRHLRWVFALILLSLIILIVLYFPWPSPRPLPFSSVQIEAGGGSRGYSKFQTYTSSLSLGTLKNYYSFQLWFFCDNWHWEITAEKISTYCTPYTGQMFNLSLESQSDGKVLVTQEDYWYEL
jgi:hypothetical protein